MNGIYGSIGAIVCLIGHLLFESTVMPSIHDCLLIAYYGCFVLGMGYILWTVGIKKGNFKLLTVLSYGNPILSVALLVLFNHADPAGNLGLACIMVTGGAIMAKGA